MLSNRMNFSCCVIWNGFPKSSHKYRIIAKLYDELVYIIITDCSYSPTTSVTLLVASTGGLVLIITWHEYIVLLSFKVSLLLSS